MMGTEVTKLSQSRVQDIVIITTINSKVPYLQQVERNIIDSLTKPEIKTNKYLMLLYH
jgi:hypothetical protein